MKYLKRLNSNKIRLSKANGNFDLAKWVEITEDEFILLKAKCIKLCDLETFLRNTDWMAIKDLDLPGSETEDQKQDRIDARSAYNAIEVLVNLQDVIDYDISQFNI